MKTANQKLRRLLACVLAMLLTLTAAVPVFADDLKITIKNAQGLPAMVNEQFTAYQIFTGTPYREGAAQGGTEWGATNWNNYTLADIEWGSDIKSPNDLITALKAADRAVWPEFYPETDNVFAGLNYNGDTPAASARALADILVKNNTNAFLQAFSEFVVHGSENRGHHSGTNGFVQNGTKSTAQAGANTPADDTSTITVPKPGYYLVAEDHPLSGSRAVESEFILAVLGDQTINLKVDIPDVKKDIVVDADTTAKGDVAGVGDTVTFRLTGTVAEDIDIYDTYKYVFTDTLSKGLTYQYDAQVYLQRDGAKYAITSGFTIEPNSKPTTSELPSSDTKITITFEDLKEIAPTGLVPFEIQGKDEIVVEYTAVLNENSLIGSKANPNKVYLEYANNPHDEGTGKTEEKTVYVYAFGLDLTKIGSDATHTSGLAGAGFVLKDQTGNYAIFKDQYTNADGTAFSDTPDATYTVGPIRRLTGWTSGTSSPTTDDVKNRIEAATDLAGAKSNLAAYLLESGNDGAIPDIYGLDEGTYALEEFIVPAGYNTPEKDFDIKIDATINASSGQLEKVEYAHNGITTTYDAASNESGNLMGRFTSGLLKDTITNQKAPFLPFTGGKGTLIFYVLGVTLIAGAAAYLVISSRKRRKAEGHA